MKVLWVENSPGVFREVFFADTHARVEPRDVVRMVAGIVWEVVRRDGELWRKAQSVGEP
jgi:hypothetical protein